MKICLKTPAGKIFQAVWLEFILASTTYSTARAARYLVHGKDQSQKT